MFRQSIVATYLRGTLQRGYRKWFRTALTWMHSIWFNFISLPALLTVLTGRITLNHSYVALPTPNAAAAVEATCWTVSERCSARENNLLHILRQWERQQGDRHRSASLPHGEENEDSQLRQRGMHCLATYCPPFSHSCLTKTPPISSSLLSSSLLPPQAPHVVQTVPRVIASSIEHPAILAYLRHLQSVGSIALDIVGVTAEVTGGCLEHNDIPSLSFYLQR